MSLNFRPARPDDLSALIGLYRHLNPDDSPASDAEAIWQTILAREGLGVIVGELGERIVSTCMVMIVPNLTRGGRPFALIENVVTDAAMQGQGIGTAMLAHALTGARAAGCYKVMLATGRDDEAVFRFYEKAGFTRGSKTCFEARLPL